MPRTLEQLQLIATFADALPAAIWVGRAPSGECVYVNQAFERILGIRPPEDASRGNYVGPYGVHTRAGEPYPEDRMPYERVMRSRAPEVIDDLVIHRHDGAKTYLRVFASPLLEGGEVAFVVEAFIDITREVELEERRARGERELQLTRRREAIGSLASGIAHDFNNLLSIVKLTAGALRAGEREPARLELLAGLDDVADSAAHLTRGLLGSAGRGKNLAERVSLNAIARAMVDVASRTFERRLTLTAALCAGGDVVVGDASQLEQVVMNLLMNARDAIAGAGRIVVTTRAMVLAADDDPGLPAGRYVVLEVEDTGAGIDPSIRDRLFEPYVSTKGLGAQKGAGLGLATIYGIAQTHGGRAEVASTGPLGTTVRVLLPAIDAAAPAPAPAPPQGRAPAVTRGAGPVLVVDDEPGVLKACGAILRGLGYEVVLAPGGREALEAFRERQGDFRAVVLDMSMPGMDGRATYLALRDVRADIPVVLTTGFSLNDEAQAILDLGVRAFLPKPFNVAQLSETLTKLTARA
jgi:PAS domain S-box-containing protein